MEKVLYFSYKIVLKNMRESKSWQMFLHALIWTITSLAQLFIKKIIADFSILTVFSLILVLIKKIYQTLKTEFDHIFKPVKVHQKYP